MKRIKERIFPLMGLVLVLILTYACKKDNGSVQGGGIIFNPALKYGTVTDFDGNIYKTITIGNQTWMAENLKVLHYRNGDTIPNITNATQWSKRINGAYCDYDNNPSKGAPYGKLYNWLALVDTRNICPIGWHVPTDAEW
jgi:hypothetical protein